MLRPLACFLSLTVLTIVPAASAEDAVRPGGTVAPAVAAGLDEAPPAPRDSQPRPPTVADVPLVADPGLRILERLSIDNQRALAKMIESDWKDRPEWAEMAMAVLRGQEMQPGMGWWKPAEKKYTWVWLRRRLDKNGDNQIDLEEFPQDGALAERLFDRLDRDLDGVLTPSDFELGFLSGMNMAAMKSRMIDILVGRLDVDSNGQVSAEEMLKLFQRADREQMGFVTSEDLLAALDAGESRFRPAAGQSEPDDPTRFWRMFLAGGLGWFETGPKLGDQAPDFTLPRHDDGGSMGLTDSRGKKPVVLIFGSFT